MDVPSIVFVTVMGQLTAPSVADGATALSNLGRPLPNDPADRKPGIERAGDEDDASSERRLGRTPLRIEVLLSGNYRLRKLDTTVQRIAVAGRRSLDHLREADHFGLVFVP